MAEKNATEIPLKIYTDDEIDVILSGDRRQVDRILIHGINGIAAIMISHIRDESEILHAIGDAESYRIRKEWIITQMDKERAKSAMMKRVSESAVTWALLLFLGFLAVSVANSAVEFVKSHISMGTPK